MLVISFAAFSAAVLLGLLLAALHMRRGAGLARLRLGLLHGVIGGFGLAALAVALRDVPLGVLIWDAVALLTATFLAGATYLVRARQGRPPELVLVLHGVLAVLGYVLLAAYVGSR